MGPVEALTCKSCRQWDTSVPVYRVTAWLKTEESSVASELRLDESGSNGVRFECHSAIAQDSKTATTLEPYGKLPIQVTQTQKDSNHERR